MILSESSVPVVEAGGTATWTVALGTRAGRRRRRSTCRGHAPDTGAVTVGPPSLTFTGGAEGDWSTPRTVTVTGVPDDAIPGDRTATDLARPSRAAATTRCRAGSVTVTVTVNDDGDGREWRSRRMRCRWGRMAASATYTLTLTLRSDEAPAGDVTVTLVGSSTGTPAR